jgi:hypothetical protein
LTDVLGYKDRENQLLRCTYSSQNEAGYAHTIYANTNEVCAVVIEVEANAGNAFGFGIDSIVRDAHWLK